MTKKVLLIGGSGSRGKLYMEEIMSRPDLSLSACVYHQTVPIFPKEESAPIWYKSLSEALENGTYDLAVVSVPHGLHHDITMKLLQHGISLIIKEKPLAVSTDHLIHYPKCSIMTTTQRSILPSYQKGKELLRKIGKIVAFHYEYNLGLKEPTSGWRLNRELACGGVLLDMGYHVFEVLANYFGNPQDPQSLLPEIRKCSFSYADEETHSRGLEDRATIDLTYNGVLVGGKVTLDRYSTSCDCFSIYGEQGIIKIYRDSSTIHQTSYPSEYPRGRSFYVEKLDKGQQISRMFDKFLGTKEEDKLWRERADEIHRSVVQAIETCYLIADVSTD